MKTLLPTATAGSLPKPSWLAQPEKLWSPWSLQDEQLAEGKRDALLLALKEQELAGIDIVWGTAPQADEIRKLDHERLLKDAVFAEEATSDDLALAQALLAERSPEAVAARDADKARMRLDEHYQGIMQVIDNNRNTSPSGGEDKQ